MIQRRWTWRARSLALALATLLLPAALAGESARAGSTPTAVAVSFDQHHQLASGVVADEELVIRSSAGTETIVPLGLPAASDLDAYLLGDVGTAVSTSTTVLIDGIVAEPGDVVLLSAGGALLLFDASAMGLVGADVDAITIGGSGDLLLSFSDSVLDASGLLAADEDVLLFDGGALHLVFDGSAAGIPEAADLDALHWDSVGARFWLSLDRSAALGALVADDEDVVAYSAATGWEMILDLSAVLPGAGPLDVDALWGESVDPDLIFADDFESGDVSGWTLSVP